MATESGYWYEQTTSTELLQAVRRFRRAHEAMRRHVSVDMGLNPVDLRALQLVVASERRGEPASPHQLASELNLSSGAMTKLVDRLIQSDHLRRAPHPHDRRSVRLIATPRTHDELRERMAGMHERMAEAAAAVPVECRPAVVSFLDAMSCILDQESTAPPVT